MATFSTLEIKNLAGRAATATVTIQAQVNNASSNAATMASLIRSAGDDSSAILAADWDALSEIFKRCGKNINDCGEKMKTALNEYSSQTQQNETTTATKTNEVSSELSSVASYFSQ